MMMLLLLMLMLLLLLLMMMMMMMMIDDGDDDAYCGPVAHIMMLLVKIISIVHDPWRALLPGSVSRNPQCWL